MRRQVKPLLIVFVLITTLLMGCNIGTPTPTVTPIITNIASPIISPSPTGNETSSPTATPDTKTTASIVDTVTAFEKAIGSNGTWIICLLKDLTLDKDLVLDGEFTNGKKDASGKEIIQRKIALYTQDKDRKVVDRFTLTAPKLTIKSPMASIQHGTFKGDLYITAKNFELVDAKIDGDVYFTNAEAKASFKMDDASDITGKQIN